MVTNPYQPPSLAANDPQIAGPNSRPIGIAILAVLHIAGGVLIAALGVFLATQFGDDDSNSIVAWVATVGAPIMTVLAIATGIGLWRGHKWAWWLATLYYFQFVVGGACLLAVIPVAYFFLDRPITERSIALAGKHTVRIALFWFLTWYITKPNVLAYFRFQKLNRLRALGISTAIIVAFVLVGGLLIFLALSSGARL